MSDHTLAFFKDKKILVFGLGILGGGVGVVNTLVELGAKVRVTDAKSEKDLESALQKINISQLDKLTLGLHEESDIEWSEIVIKNPAVPTNSPFIQKAISLNKHVTTEAALYLKHSLAFTIGVTGTRGKTTTTTMIYEMLKECIDNKVLIGGNIQHKGCLPLLLEEDAETFSVVELSSWALEGCHIEKVSPKIAVVTNLFPDHLNRYPNMEAYAFDKAAIFQYQQPEDHVFLNTEHEWFEYFRDKVESNLHLFDSHSLPKNFELKIPGEHNRHNAAAAFSVGKLIGLPVNQIRESLEQFTGVQYRQQRVGEKHGLIFINDSTSTTPKALDVALETFPTATFIIGGATKHLDVTELANKITNHKGLFIFLKGSGTQELIDAIKQVETSRSDIGTSLQNIQTFESLQDAFQEAIKQTPSGEIVFSPGFTSFELFKNEFDRAQQFDALVSEYIQG